MSASFALACTVLVCACKEKYTPTLKDINPNYLVIDGFINTGGDSTIFKISRTFKIDNKAVSAPERSAIVTVESDGGLNVMLPELTSKPGTYSIPSLGQDQTKKYRLRVKTKEGKEYLSDFVESKVSQPVNITCEVRHGNVLNMYANSSDPTGKSRYYRFNYEETWEYVAPFLSSLKVVDHQLRDRVFPQDDIYHCYRYVKSGRIALASTQSLTEDKLADYTLEVIPEESEKIRMQYSIYVEQYVLTKAGFDFFEALRKNTEQVGSIFDSQPSQLFGNISCITAPNETVIGFVSAGTVTKKRIVLLAKELPFPPKPVLTYGCVTRKLKGRLVKELILDPSSPEFLPLYEDHDDNDSLIVTAAPCADCRLRGGILTKPSYWRQ
ncbi:DUF4249 domain-containing protein [Mucilaginibacter auburnensis]|uniref:Uncharacterized protein DUF4249 n=1 Tax=Mucilaginibacter auburnensis TaxID=1457233 RepID=A0A2H9VVS0_9SPHI|nr:DUF4249 domain-containing protein [Mucilaginibacter auburnensis]PJJ84889.1 uncharacterized protein DUF4249 [Mucilaginibacter auburnensis]